MADLLIRGERVLLPEGMRPASIRIQDGRIVAVGSVAERNSGTTTIDAGEMVVMPGLVDTHVHVNEPGRTEWEGFATATRAAAAGGITTIVDMPLNSVPATTTVMGLQAKLDAARGRCRVDVGFWGGVVPGNESQIEPLAAAGVLGFKCFLSPSGVDEFEHVTEGTLRGAMPVVAGTSLPLLVHAELPEHLRDAIAGADPSKHATWLATRPPEAEAAAVALMIALAREFGTRVHIVHVAAEAVIAQVAGAKAAGLPVTAETCPHYLSICAEEIPDGAVQFKCAPPIRERSHRDALWEALRSGTLDLVATDHSPAPPEIKGMATGDFLNGWGGIASLQLALPLVWTQARAHGFDVATISRWLSAAPARLAGLEAQKGRIAAGMDADLVIWDPDRKFQVDAATLHHRHKVTPYTGWVLQGRVERTLLRGTTVYEGGDFPGRPSGRVLRRGTANIPGR